MLILQKRTENSSFFVFIPYFLLSGFILKLAVVEVGVEAAAPHQFLMRSALYHIAVAHNKNKVGIFNGGKAVRDYKAGAPPFVSVSIACRIKSSVRVSTEEVASSRMSMGAFLQHGAGNGESCFCPAEMPALSERTVSKPCGSV